MSTDKVISVTPRALRKALATRDGEPDASNLALFLEVGDPSGFEFSYDLYLDDKSSARPEDHVQEEDGLTIVIPQRSVEHLRGATLDLSKDLLKPGWVVDNPNTPSPAVGQRIPPSELTGSPEERVRQVLEMVINPSIASHGGRADLVEFTEAGVARLALSGGCQGCGMARVTLSQGIEVALRDAIPEITAVEDVTDHTAGANPYYESSKK